MEIELEDYQRDLEEVITERDRIKEALEETIEFCDTVSYEHDLLLIQNSKLKKLLSVVTDKLIRIDSKHISDLDFSEILNDPCKDFKPTGILKEKPDSKYGNVHVSFTDQYDNTEYEMFQSKTKQENPKKEERNRKIPPTPKFTLEGNSFSEEDIFVSSFDYKPSQSGLLNMGKGDKIHKLSELDDWFFGENLRTGDKGFFPPNFVWS